MTAKKFVIIMCLIWVVTTILIVKVFADTEPLLHGFAYGNGSLYRVDYNDGIKICFETPELMAKFLEQNPVGKFNITVPCPPEKLSPNNNDLEGR